MKRDLPIIETSGIERSLQKNIQGLIDQLLVKQQNMQERWEQFTNQCEELDEDIKKQKDRNYKLSQELQIYKQIGRAEEKLLRDFQRVLPNQFSASENTTSETADSQ